MSHDADTTPVATQVVTIPGQWVFEPATAVVEAGVPVAFRNHGGTDHTVTFDALPFDVNIEPGGEASHSFDEPGTYSYTCKYHPPGMKGTIIVQAQET